MSKKMLTILGCSFSFLIFTVCVWFYSQDRYERLDDVAVDTGGSLLNDDHGYWVYYFYDSRKKCRIIEIPVGHLTIKPRRDRSEEAYILFTGGPIPTEMPCREKVKKAILFVPQDELANWQEWLSKKESRSE